VLAAVDGGRNAKTGGRSGGGCAESAGGGSGGVGGGGGGGESVRREVQTETIGRGAESVTRTTVIETRTTSDGRTETTRTFNETKATAADNVRDVSCAVFAMA